MGKITQRILSNVYSRKNKQCPSKLALVTTLIICQLLTAIEMVLAQPTTAPTSPDFAQQIQPPSNQFSPRPLPVGLIINGKTKLDSFTILGQEDGSRAINFEDWLLPFDELSKALGLKIKEIDGKLDISTSSQRFKLPAEVVVIDKTLGRAIAVRDLAKIPGFVVNFDLYKYAIDLQDRKSVV